jgi:hypothetical protein
MNRLELEGPVRRIDGVDELRDLRTEFGRVARRGGGDLNEDDSLRPLGEHLQETFEGSELFILGQYGHMEWGDGDVPWEGHPWWDPTCLGRR